MRSRARLHHHSTRGKLRHLPQQLRARHLPMPHLVPDPILRMQMKRALADINAYQSNSVHNRLLLVESPRGAYRSPGPLGLTIS